MLWARTADYTRCGRLRIEFKCVGQCTTHIEIGVRSIAKEHLSGLVKLISAVEADL